MLLWIRNLRFKGGVPLFVATFIEVQAEPDIMLKGEADIECPGEADITIPVEAAIGV